MELRSMSPNSMYGLLPASPGITAAPLAMSGGRGLDDSERPWHPSNPLFWFGAIAAVTLGFIGFASSARVGPLSAGVKVGT